MVHFFHEDSKSGPEQEYAEHKRIPVSFVLVLGGHTFEALALVDILASKVKPLYIVCDDNILAKDKIRIPGPIDTIPTSFEAIRTKRFLGLLMNFFLFFKALVKSFRILKTNGSKAVISCGSGSSLAPIIAAKVLGKKVIFIESACRVKSRSLCGNMVYTFLSDLFLVQWEEQIKAYPKVKYAGRPF